MHDDTPALRPATTSAALKRALVRLPTAASAALLCAVLLSHGAHAAIVSLEYSDSSTQSLSVTARQSSTFPGLNPVPQVPSTILFVPGFDSSLGTLLSARLSINGYLATKLHDHAVGLPGLVSSGHDVTVRVSGNVTNSLDQIIQSSNDPGFKIRLENDFSPYSASVFQIINNPGLVVRREQSAGIHFDETFIGIDLLNFVDALEGLSFYLNSGSKYLAAFGYHSSDLGSGAIEDFTTLPTTIQPGTAPGRQPGVGTLISAITTAAQIVDAVMDHGLVYNELHIGAATELDMRVIYTYQEAGTTGSDVPEPGTLAIFGLGIAGLALIRRRMQRDTPTGCEKQAEP
jgi:hypothetical protein